MLCAPVVLSNRLILWKGRVQNDSSGEFNWRVHSFCGKTSGQRWRRIHGTGMFFMLRCRACLSHTRDNGSVWIHQNTWRDYVAVRRRGNAPEMGVTTTTTPKARISSNVLVPDKSDWGNGVASSILKPVVNIVSLKMQFLKQNPKMHRNRRMQLVHPELKCLFLGARSSLDATQMRSSYQKQWLRN